MCTNVDDGISERSRVKRAEERERERKGKASSTFSLLPFIPDSGSENDE